MKAVDTQMKGLLAMTAVIEAGAGFLFVVAPSSATKLLFGAALDGSVAVIVARLAGVALLTLAVASWQARRDGETRAANGLVAGMVLYNAGAATFLAYAGIGLRLSGICLWPAVLLHTAMTAWCVIRLLKRAALT